MRYYRTITLFLSEFQNQVSIVSDQLFKIIHLGLGITAYFCPGVSREIADRMMKAVNSIRCFDINLYLSVGFHLGMGDFRIIDQC